MNRKIAPKTVNINQINWVSPEAHAIGDYCTLYYLEDRLIETCKIDFSFYLNKSNLNLINSLSYSLLTSGNESISGSKIKEKFDFFGAYLDIQVYAEIAELTIYVLKHNLMKSIEWLFENIASVNFPKNEYLITLNEKKSSFLTNSNKVASLARKEFQKRVFSNSALAKTTELDDFKKVQIEDIHATYQNDIRNSLFQVALVGNVQKEDLDHLIKWIEPWQQKKEMSFDHVENNEAGIFHLPKEGALQSAIRIGGICMQKSHPEYIEFSILNTILGDYFGSRLMKNIREDKGYTYGIGTILQHFKQTSYLTIATQVGTVHRENTLIEIKKEIELLQSTLVSKEELTLVSNYLLGQALKAADGSFAQMSLFLNANAHGLDMSYYNRYLHALQTVSTEKLRELAEKHLLWERFSIVSAG